MDSHQSIEITERCEREGTGEVEHHGSGVYPLPPEMAGILKHQQKSRPEFSNQEQQQPQKPRSGRGEIRRLD